MTHCTDHRSTARRASQRVRSPQSLLATSLLAALLGACATGPKIAEPIAEAPSADSEPGIEEVERVGPPEERLNQALAFLRNDQLEAAERALEELVDDYPDSSGPLTNLGILHARAGRFDEAIEAFVKAVQRKPDNLVARNWLGHVQRRKNQPERAERAWLDALRVDPDYVNAHINLGLLYEQVLADAPRAIRHYRAAFEASQGSELRVLPWIAQLEARIARSDSAPGTAPVSAPAEEPQS